MATRKVQTPGATEPVVEVQQEQVEKVQTPETVAPTNEELLAQIAELKAQVASQSQSTGKSQSVAKRTRAVVGPNGWTTEEY